ncbi:MAG TPA: D-alanine--D-alanine ligase [Gammaproteobacteria bacterium]|nr:D-alanine--D-alanine ligase [Gammaproteobacteria bacterium]
MTVTESIRDPRKFGRVAVVLGGTSAEREISLLSGQAVLAALREQGIDAHPVDPQDDGVMALINGGFDRACIMLHGRDGEDGTIQGLLELIGIPYTGSGVLGSALSMDKLRTKQVWQTLSLPTPAYAQVRSVEELRAFVGLVGCPVAVKPAREGSSIGVTHLTREEDIEAAYRGARDRDELVIAERWITGGEYFCSVLDGEALPIVRMETPHDFYDYDAKYFSDDTRYFCPCGLTEAQERELGEMCLRAFEAFGGSGWGRMDFILDANGQPWLIEGNTVPGMTGHSLVPMAAKAVGIDFGALCWRILETSFVERGAV